MTEWPDIDGLLDAVRFHLETNVLPVIKTDARLYFQTLVALNLLKIGQREITQSHDLLRQEWAALNKLRGEEAPPPEQEHVLAREIAARRTALAKDTRSGKYDSPDQEALLVAYLEETVAAQLALNNPSLSARMTKEAADQSYAL